MISKLVKKGQKTRWSFLMVLSVSVKTACPEEGGNLVLKLGPKRARYFGIL